MDERSLSVEEASENTQTDDPPTAQPDSAPRRASSQSKIVEDQRFKRQSEPDCSTALSHNRLPKDQLSSSILTGNRSQRCGTTLSHNRPRGLWLRGSIYQYRVRVPPDLVNRLGRTHISVSLKTGSIPDAKRALRVAAFEIESHFSSVRGGAVLSSSCENHCANRAPIGLLTLDKAYERYLADPAKSRSQKTLLSYATAGEVILSLLGKETPLETISRQQCRDLLADLNRLPPNAKKRWPLLTAREAILKAAEIGMSGMSPANANGLMNKFSAVLNWCVQEELLGRNPAKGLRLADPIAAKDKRRPFTLSQLQRIFDAPLFTGCQDDDTGYAKSGPMRPRRARFWVPLIGLFSGMRLNEICQMDVEDIASFHGVHCFSVNAQSLRPSDKHLKSAASERLVPIHPLLLEIGFMSYVEDRRRAEDSKLFPELPLRHGIYSHLFSRWFGRFLRGSGAAAERTCFHSFRHNFRDALRSARVDREITLSLGGWTGGMAVADRYGSGYGVERLNEALSCISYDGLSLQHLVRT